jgi:hypothetical protein
MAQCGRSFAAISYDRGGLDLARALFRRRELEDVELRGRENRDLSELPIRLGQRLLRAPNQPLMYLSFSDDSVVMTFASLVAYIPKTMRPKPSPNIAFL